MGKKGRGYIQPVTVVESTPEKLSRTSGAAKRRRRRARARALLAQQQGIVTVDDSDAIVRSNKQVSKATGNQNDHNSSSTSKKIHKDGNDTHNKDAESEALSSLMAAGTVADDKDKEQNAIAFTRVSSSSSSSEDIPPPPPPRAHPGPNPDNIVHIPLNSDEAWLLANDGSLDFSRISHIPVRSFYELRAHIGWLLHGDGAQSEFDYLYTETAAEFTMDRCTHALVLANREKNRYANVLPYNMNRVRLGRPFHHEKNRLAVSVSQKPLEGMAQQLVIETEDETTTIRNYINATYLHAEVRGRDLAYIATQGPKDSTQDDFWRMVWEQHASVVVMLGRHIENNVLKFHRYWPDTPDPIDTLLVTLQRVSHKVFTDFHHYVYKMRNKRTGEEREVVHLMFTAFPDHGIPETTTGFMELVETAELETRTRSKAAGLPSPAPLIVHCSAGLGRTGVFCCVSIALGKALLGAVRAFDIRATMVGLRRQRANMIQTKEQMVFCYLCLLDKMQPFFTNTNYESNKWYHGAISGKEAEKRLKSGNRKGVFLFRACEAQDAKALAHKRIQEEGNGAPGTSVDDWIMLSVVDMATGKCVHRGVEVIREQGFIVDGEGVQYHSLEEIQVGQSDNLVVALESQ